MNSFIASASLLLEGPNRRVEIMLFTVPRFLSGFWAYLKKKGLVTGLPYGEVGLFAASMGVLMYCYQFEEEKIKKSYLSIFKKLWGAN